MSSMDFDKLPRFQGFQVQIICRVSEWADLFEVTPEEIERQINLSHGWIQNNPKKAPKTEIMRYLYNWLLIAQRKNSLLKKPRENYREISIEPDMTYEEMVSIRKQNMNSNAQT